MIPAEDRINIDRWLGEANVNFNNAVSYLGEIRDPAALDAIAELASALNNVRSSLALVVNAL